MQIYCSLLLETSMWPALCTCPTWNILNMVGVSDKERKRERATWHLISLIYLISSMRIDGDFENIKTNIYEWRFSLKLILIQEYIWEHEVSKQQQKEFFFQVAAGCHAFLVYLFLFLTHWENWEHERISKRTFAWLLLDIVEDQCEQLFLGHALTELSTPFNAWFILL